MRFCFQSHLIVLVRCTKKGEWPIGIENSNFKTGIDWSNGFHAFLGEVSIFFEETSNYIKTFIIWCNRTNSMIRPISSSHGVFIIELVKANLESTLIVLLCFIRFDINHSKFDQYVSYYDGEIWSRITQFLIEHAQGLSAHFMVGFIVHILSIEMLVAPSE